MRDWLAGVLYRLANWVMVEHKPAPPEPEPPPVRGCQHINLIRLKGKKVQAQDTHTLLFCRDCGKAVEE